MKRVWTTLHSGRSRIVLEASILKRPLSEPTSLGVDPKQSLNISAFSLENVLVKEPDFLQSDGTDHVHDETVLFCLVEFSWFGVER